MPSSILARKTAARALWLNRYFAFFVRHTLRFLSIAAAGMTRCHFRNKGCQTRNEGCYFRNVGHRCTTGYVVQRIEPVVSPLRAASALPEKQLPTPLHKTPRLCAGFVSDVDNSKKQDCDSPLNRFAGATHGKIKNNASKPL